MLGDSMPDLVVQAVTNPDAFYPDFDVQNWQEPHRIHGAAPKTLERNLLLAMGDCNAALAEWKAKLIQDAIDAGEPVPVALDAAKVTDYESAVYAMATAKLIPVLPSIITDERARENLDALHQTPGAFRARASVRLRAVRGERRGSGFLTAEVI